MGRQWTANPPFIGSNPIAASNLQKEIMNKKTFISVLLVVIAFATCVSGYVFGDPLAIWQKAANICLECIGIG